MTLLPTPQHSHALELQRTAISLPNALSLSANLGVMFCDFLPHKGVDKRTAHKVALCVPSILFRKYAAYFKSRLPNRDVGVGKNEKYFSVTSKRKESDHESPKSSYVG